VNSSEAMSIAVTGMYFFQREMPAKHLLQADVFQLRTKTSAVPEIVAVAH